MGLSTIKHLFQMTPYGENSRWMTAGISSSLAAPELIPRAGFSKNNMVPQLINVMQDFEWTHTPHEGRREVPYIRLSEQRIEFNSLIQHLRYLLTTAGQTVEGAVKMFGNVGKSIKLGNVVDKVSKVAADVKEKADNAAGRFNPGVKGANHIPTYLQPYHGLYGTSPTGFEYAFPYLEADWRQTQSQWADKNPNEGFLAGSGSIMDNLLTDVPSNIASMAMFLPGAKGAAIERPQYYQYGQGTAPAKTFTFYLLNTNRWEDVVKNWQLCFMLCYQQLPNKTSKILLEPPVIYEVEIPGIFYTPFAYISGLTIQNKGAMRSMRVPMLYQKGYRKDVNLQAPAHASRQSSTWKQRQRHVTPRKAQSPHPTKSTKASAKAGPGMQSGGVPDPVEEYVDTIVPDAYQVTIQLQSMVPDSKNFAFHSIMGPATRNSGLYEIMVHNPDEFLGKKTGLVGQVAGQEKSFKWDGLEPDVQSKYRADKLAADKEAGLDSPWADTPGAPPGWKPGN